MSLHFFMAAFENMTASIRVDHGILHVGLHTEDQRDVVYLSFSPVQACILAKFLQCVSGHIVIHSIHHPEQFGEMTVELEADAVSGINNKNTHMALPVQEPPAA